MGCLRVQILEVPEVVVGALCLGDFIVRFGFDSMDKIREFEIFLDKEHWNVVSNNIPIAWVSNQCPKFIK